MGLIRVVLSIFALWSSLDFPSGADIKLSSTTSVTEYGRSYILQCTVTGNLRSREMLFSRNTVDICKRRVFKTDGTMLCETYNNTLSSYQCLCVGYYSDVSVYRITIRSFKEVDATVWWCAAIDETKPNVLSNFVYLFYVTLSGNVTEFDADGVNSITFTCETSNITGSVTFEWINKTIEGSTYIENNLIVSKHGSTYRQELKLIPHWYQHQNRIACKVVDVSTNITAMTHSEVLDLIYPPLTSPVMKQVTNPKTPLSSEITIQEGAMLNLSCEVTGGKPRVLTVTIRCDGINPSTFYTVVGDRVTGYLSLTVWRNLHNHTCQCSATHKTGRYHLTTSVTILVNYAQGVTVRHEFNSSNKILKLICEAEGRPDNYSFSPLTHFWGEYRIRELPGQRVSPNKYVLTVRNVTYADSGKYQCGVSNGVEGLNKVKIQTNFTSIEIGGKPILGDMEQNPTVLAVLGKTIVVERKIFSKSNITRHTWTNGRGQKLLGQLSTIEVTLNIYNITVKDIGYSISLEIPKLTKDDQGLYTLNICNSFGCGHFYTTLKIAIAELVDGSTSDSVLVAAVSGVTVVVILVVIIVVAIVIVRKRRNSTKNKHSQDDDHGYMNQDNNQQVDGPTVEYVNTVNDVNNVYDVNTVNINTEEPHVYQTLNN
ncbi:uncharacterized protein LOC121385991 [Gigantopelta aegis]|uniref:uncharacterized protein LOC121385991 n=1 Tax=Gigantopelta aegis TaxID=1735272 RepID=UPI001B88B533|nr:uncharacterized protein LOC121385991 [Gigantopelta aegis]